MFFQICLHDGPDVDPDARDDVDCGYVEKKLTEYVKRHVIGVETKPSIVEHCMYTVSWLPIKVENEKKNGIMEIEYTGQITYAVESLMLKSIAVMHSCL